MSKTVRVSLNQDAIASIASATAEYFEAAIQAAVSAGGLEVARVDDE